MLILLLIIWIGIAFFCAWLATEKGRRGANWFFLGLFFGIIALLVLMAAPKVEESPLSFESIPIQTLIRQAEAMGVEFHLSPPDRVRIRYIGTRSDLPAGLHATLSARKGEIWDFFTAHQRAA